MCIISNFVLKHRLHHCFKASYESITTLPLSPTCANYRQSYWYYKHILVSNACVSWYPRWVFEQFQDSSTSLEQKVLGFFYLGGWQEEEMQVISWQGSLIEHPHGLLLLFVLLLSSFLLLWRRFFINLELYVLPTHFPNFYYYAIILLSMHTLWLPFGV